MDSKSFSFNAIYPVISEVISKGDLFAMTVNGVSMMPLLRDGLDTVYFSSLDGRKIRRGDIVLYERANGQFIMHRVYKVCKDGTFSIVGDNQVQIEQGVTQNQLRAYVPLIMRNGKKINCKKGMLRRIMVLYMLIRTKNEHLGYSLLYYCRKIKNFGRKKL